MKIFFPLEFCFFSYCVGISFLHYFFPLDLNKKNLSLVGFPVKEKFQGKEVFVQEILSFKDL